MPTGAGPAVAAQGKPKAVLACQMVAVLAGRLPGREVHVVADAHYAGADGAPTSRGLGGRGLPVGISLTSRLRRNAVLHAIATPIPGRGGRPRRIGQRLGAPADLARTGVWHRHSVYRYRRCDPILIAETVCLWYGTYRSRAVRVVLIREPGSTAKSGYDLALITTDLHSAAPDIVARYPARWSIEVAFEDARQVTGVREARDRTATAVARTVPFGLITQTLVIIWYTHHGHTPQITEERRTHAPWYRTKTQPAYLDMIVKLRRTLIAAGFLAESNDTRPPKKPSPYTWPGQKRPHRPTEVRKSSESMNTKIRLIVRVASGFHSAEAIIAMAMLSLGGHRPILPAR